MGVYGLDQDVRANMGKGVNLYVPGKTQLKQGDVFLGGTGTGVTDAMIGPATRIFGETAADTANAYSTYQRQPQPLPQQNFRRGARVTMKMKEYLDNQAKDERDYQTTTNQWNADYDSKQRQAAIENTLKQNIYDHGVTQDNFNNDLSTRELALRDAQGKADNQYKYDALGQDESQFGRTLGYNYSNSAANRRIDQQKVDYDTGVIGGTVSGGSMPAEYSAWVNDAAAKNGIPPNILAGLIEQESSWDPTNVNRVSGATGLGQFLSDTAAEEGVNRTDAKSSIYGAAAYLAKRIDWAGGDLNKGIMGYGEGTPEYLNLVLGKAKNYTVEKAVKPSDSATNSMLTQMKGALAEGATPDDLMEDLSVYRSDGTEKLRNYDSSFLTNWLQGQKTSAQAAADGITNSAFKNW